ncbi:MAG: isoamylase [Myxococcota bacterium]|jgi:isoamylase
MLLLLLLSCAAENYPRIYHTESKAPSLSWEGIEALDHMGPTIVDRGVNFAAYSEAAERIELLLFDDPESELPTQQYEMIRQGDVWNLYVEGLGLGQHYGYIAWGPNWPHDPEFFPGSTVGFLSDVDSQGNRFNPNKLLSDPWCKAVHRDHDWSAGSTASGPSRAEVTYDAASKSVITASDYTWSEQETQWRAMRESGEHPGHDWTDLIIYEVHPKGFTKNVASEVDHPGTWRGIGEMAPYLQDLGITAVELLPVHEKPLDGGYWGYNNLSFFAPELSYSAEYAATGLPDEIVDEFKWMVDQLHQHDIEVIIDVVYNHTGEGGLWRERLYFETYEDAYAVNYDPKEVAGLYNFRGLDNNAFYALAPDGETYWNNTGVGNQTRPNHTPMKRLIMDSLQWMVDDLHVDGFRFDLAGILGEPDGAYNEWIDPSETVLQDIIDDPILQQYNTRIISEPWTAAGTGPGIGGFPTASNDDSFAWLEWNAHFRDWWRSIVNNDDWVLSSDEGGVDGGGSLTGSESVYGWNGRSPYHAVNFVTVHDGFTMYDMFSYEEKQNGCGLLNPVCCDNPKSVWCDSESGEDNNRSRDWGQSAEPFKRQQMRNLFTALMISHGTPLILGGDEWMRSQFGNNNAYSDGSDNQWNWFRWGEWRSAEAEDRHRMHDFVRDIIALRRDRTYALSPSEYGGGMPFSWKDASNNEMAGDGWNGRQLAIHYYSTDAFPQPELFIIINMERGDVTYTLPEGRTWARLVDTQQYFDTPGTSDESGGYFDENLEADVYTSANVTLDAPEVITGGSYTATSTSIIILEEVK